MFKTREKCINALLVSMLVIITLFAVFTNVPGLNGGKVLALEEGVISTGQRTITQPLSNTATDLHFVVYQADRDDAWILDWGIELSVPFTKISAVTDQWPFNDGRIHSVAIDIEGINVPYGASVDIIATLNLNTYNTVKFADIQWTYADHAPVSAMSANTGWAVATNPGTSQGGWLISKYTTVDLYGKPPAVDLVGHQFLNTNVSPALNDLSISNGTPTNPGSSTVKIIDWGVAIVSTLPSWNDIKNWQNWDQYSGNPVYLGPGQTVRFPNIIVTVTPIPTPVATPTPTPQGVISTGRRTITNPLSIPATDLHFIVYQADRTDAWILGWGIELSTSFTSIHGTPGSWPFDDGRIHSVAIDIEGINVPGGASVDIIATLNLNTYNTVKFADIKWTYAPPQEPVSITPDLGWAVATNPGTSQGGWLISKYTTVDLGGKPVAVDLVGHQFLKTNASPALSDLSVSNGTPTNPGSKPVRIIGWGVAVVPTLPTWEEINNWTNWNGYIGGPIDLNPGQKVSFPTPTATPTPTPGIINLALNKPASASSSLPGREPFYGNDGSTTTRWSAANPSPGHWWKVDLGSIRNITGSEVMWEFAGIVYKYKVETSTDNVNWILRVDKTNNISTAQIQNNPFTASARYVRITVTGLSSTGIYGSFYEFRVFGN